VNILNYLKNDILIIKFNISQNIFFNIFKKSYYLFLAGIILFSFNCYLYGITHLKVFAMIIPLGGISFLIAWALMTFTFLKKDLK
jgi:uncharacterized membrane protein YgdD (TMEM256/DUF423 family)